MNSPLRLPIWRRIPPALLLIFLAPLIAEVLPGATRFSSLFVLPVEMCVWGGGALIIREAARKWRLGWCGRIFLALALAVAEETLIQQTSLAPMVLKLKGAEYARALGINYVYLLWALVYETVFVVLVPIALVEYLAPERRDDAWIRRKGMVATGLFFTLGCFLAWYSWTRLARPNVFHVPIYNPSVNTVLSAVLIIASLVVTAIAARKASVRSASPPPLAALGGGGALWAVLWYGLVLLGFGIAPTFPPTVAIVAGLFLAATPLCLLPRWSAHASWSPRHTFAVFSGTIAGSMLVSFIGFIGAAPWDLGFKIIVDVIAAWFLWNVRRDFSSAPEQN